MAPNAAVDALRAVDPDRYLATLYAPGDRRDALQALLAFDAEIAAVRDRVRQPLAGEIRLQWWRDAIEAGETTGNPLADALIEAIRRHDLPKSAFGNCLEARIFDLYDDPMPSRTDLEGYLGETSAAIIQMGAMILDREAASRATEAAGHAGCVVGLVALLAMLPLHRSRRQCYVPRDILAAAGSTPEAFLDGSASPSARMAVEAMLALAHEHVAAFRGGAAALPAPLRPAFLPVALATLRLKLMAEDAAALLEGRARVPSLPRRHWSLFRAATRGWPAR